MAKNLVAVCLMFLVASSVIYEVQGTFLLKLYLRRKIFPRRCIDFTPFACKTMLLLVSNLQKICPITREFKEFFTNLSGYMSYIESASDSSNDIDDEMDTKCEGLAKAMSVLTGVKDAINFKLTMLSMGKTLIEQRRRGSLIMTFSQKKELAISMVKWTKMLITFVKTASEKEGKSIDVSSYGLDVDVDSIVGNESDNDESTDSKSQNSGSKSKGNASKTASTESSGNGGTFQDTTGGSSSSPSESPTGTISSSSKSKESSGGKFASGSSKAGSKSTYSNTSGAVKGSPSGSSTYNSPSSPSETSRQGSPSDGGSGSSKTKNSRTGKSEFESTKTGNDNTFSDATGATTGSPSGSPTNSPSNSTDEGGETIVKGRKNGASETEMSSSDTPLKDVESETSKEVMSFITGLEKKYAGKADLKVFFEKLKTSISATSKISSTDASDFLSGMKSAVVKLFDAMAFVRSRFSKSAEMKTSMESCQEEMMKTLKELQAINSEIANQSQGKTVTVTQKTELKQTITKLEKVTTLFVETAASSSHSSSSGESNTDVVQAN